VADGKAYGIPRRDGRARREEVTTPISGERIKELREYLTTLFSLDCEYGPWPSSSESLQKDLLALLDDHAALVEEVERLKKQVIVHDKPVVAIMGFDRLDDAPKTMLPGDRMLIKRGYIAPRGPEKAEAEVAALKADNAYLTDKWREADMEWGKAVYQLQRAEARAAEYERKWSELVEVVATRTDQAKTMGVK
jgi:hypothetical protein